MKERRRYVSSLEDIPDLFLHRAEPLQDVLRVGVPLHQSGAAVRLVLPVRLRLDRFCKGSIFGRLRVVVCLPPSDTLL